ncbi:NADH-ubiquinone oxidoreductase-F iron-sulfur binding region domain-containing protein [Nocardioides sp. T2.26MG-1]|uniref:NADH-ubiquinone oxidoreductase-F iron-sulfur binding region domain-containing protein n=1 Tax=Nocardioides sp. T2.26MG-1 TaxID=3041166 RepID=UPI00247760A5|nr:NADH-ubiquinone oxidoreductase-F iron-sulfur binding region domain-containing protein [Nocardioides sp. T2.26MG-1]CAI9411943.1 Ion-translocating oxidoreductase complex subunit C [Nocardioides sp. T2.26MG-1]
MTTVGLPAASPTAFGTARLLGGVTHGGRADLTTHRRVHGPQHHRTLDELAADASRVRLLGRGGAAFPVATKLAAVPVGPRTQVVVNGSESEPASRKDRTLMTLTPHLVLDGALAVARALRTTHVTIAVHDEAAYASLRAALEERTRREPVTGRVDLHRQPAGFVSGEVRAVLRGLDGGPAVPPSRRTLPSVSGLHGAPTFASNVETFAQVALLISLGPAEYAAVGDPEEPGTTLLTLLGDTRTRGVVEVPTDLPLDALVPGEGGPVLLGGYHGRWVHDVVGRTAARPGLRAAGLPLNAGVVARLPRDVCALAEVTAVARWLAAQSAGQCGPCLFGTAAAARDVGELLRGRAAPAVEARVAGLVRRGACAHPDGTAAFVASALEALPDELAEHRRHGTCGRPYGGVLPLDGAG